MKKTKILLALVIAVTLTFASCGQKEESEKKENPLEKVAAAYEEQIKKHEEIDFAIDESGMENPTFEYKYTLANINDDDIPELIVMKADKSFGMEYSKVFYYDKEKDKLLSPKEALTTGVAGSGGFRGGLAASNKKDGLLLNTGSSSNGQFTLERINLETKEDGEAAFKYTTLKEYTLGEENVDEGESLELKWYEIDDLSALEKLALGDLKPEEKKESEKAKDENENKEEPKSAVVDNKTVFQGTLKYLTYNEVLDLQGIEDPNAGYADTSQKFALLVFDRKISVTATNGDGQGTASKEAAMINLMDLQDAGKYNGQTIKVKINQMFWPSDTSLPIGEPYAQNGSYEIVK